MMPSRARHAGKKSATASAFLKATMSLNDPGPWPEGCRRRTAGNALHLQTRRVPRTRIHE